MYRCYLFGVLMPETPGKLSLKIKGQNRTVTLLNEGEINLLKLPGLTEISLSLTFPMLSGVRTPDFYLNLLEKAKTGRQTTQFIMTRTSPDGRLLFDTNIKVSVEDYTIEENAENGLDVSVAVKLKQYRSYGTKTITIKTEDAGEASPNIAARDKVTIMEGAMFSERYEKMKGLKIPAAYIGNPYTVQEIETFGGETEARIMELYMWLPTKYLRKQGSSADARTVLVKAERPAESAPHPTTYTVQEGDTLWSIAKQFSGEGDRYMELYAANKEIVTNPNLISAGYVLTIPW